MTPLRAALLDLVLTKGLRVEGEPLQLASGERSRYFIDAKRALAAGADLATACRAMVEAAGEAGVAYDAVGGLTLGADQFAHGVAVVGGASWFVVRKAPKGRGTNQRIEGAALGPASRVLLVDDIVTTGGSIQQAHQVVEKTGATVVAAVTVVDRSGRAGAYFDQVGVPYLPLLSYTDLGIPRVGDE